MKKYLLIAVLCVLISGCRIEGKPDADKIQAKQTREALAEADAQIGMPAIKNFRERKLAKMIFELRDQADLVCYAYTKSDYTGKLIFIGKCIGYGLPYSIQYTNPMITKRAYNGAFEILPQADPNGLFMPEGLSATWLMMINPKTNEPVPVYVEPELVVSPFPLH